MAPAVGPDGLMDNLWDNLWRYFLREVLTTTGVVLSIWVIATSVAYDDWRDWLVIPAVPVLMASLDVRYRWR